MTLSPSIRRRSLRCLVLAAFAVGALVAMGGAGDAEARRPSCGIAAIERLDLPVTATVDEIRVDVARTSPRAGAATVRIDAGRFGRQLRVSGSSSRGLKFSPALTGRRFDVALDPAFDAQSSACVERITLLHDGRKVATVTP